eukprot:TRINITY_DN6886_c2_g1_i6.p1 TRINITY_DN6886_c2_g1~~TRINITY_DN6886_c2_g1_i6.p1  ORF type:complete len:296 (+),score=65.27 TRINITY_DN6886_c2_g1_i6:300-1187(+)
MQIYDDRSLRWVDLVSSEQLHTDRCQVYAFRESGGSPVRDTQQEMPQPRAPTLSQGGYSSPSAYSPGGGGAYSSPRTSGGPYQTNEWRMGKERPNVPLSDKVQTVFNDFNVSRTGGITHQELGSGFKNVGIDFAAITIDELFAKADLNRDQRVTFDEWQHWCKVYPNTLECVYFRGRDKAEEDEVMRGLQAVEIEAQQNDGREAQLRRELEGIQARKQDLDRQQQEYRARQAEFLRRKDTLEAQERDLMEQEIRLERQRDHLRAQEARFQQAANNFDAGAQQSASPRRAMRSGGL